MGFCLTQAFIFDFDGTLVDSKVAIYECFQKITKELAPERIKFAKSIHIGPPLETTATEILGNENINKVENFIKKFISMHDDEVILKTTPYPKVIETIEFLYAQKIPMSIATNKRSAPTLKLISHYGWMNYFEFVECSDSGKNKITKDEMIKNIIKKNKQYKTALFIGDTNGDYLAAKKNNLKFIYANYGYGDIESFYEEDNIISISSISNIINLIK